MPRIGKGLREMILFSLAGMGGEEAKATIEDLHNQTGLSVGYIYKLTDLVRLNGRAVRKDAGLPRLDLTEEQFEAVRGFTTRYDLTAEHAIELAELNGIIEPKKLKTYRYNEWLRSRGQERSRHKEDVAPVRRFEAKGPNVLHHFDTTKLEQLHYDEETGMLSWNPRANRKNSRGEKPDSIWLYSLVDDFSRCKFAYLYRSLNQYNHLDFFFRAWSEKQNPTEFPFFGIPAHLYMDKGGGNYALKVLHAIHKLGIHLVPTDPSTWEPFGARKHGKVETVFRQYAEWLKIFQIRPLHWDEAQESLYCELSKLNTKIHSVTRERPFERWLKIPSARHMPDADLYSMLKYDHDWRRVNSDLTFSVDAHLYRLPLKRPYIDWIKRQKVEIYWEPGKYEKVYAVNGSTEIELAECRDNIVRPAFSYPREEREQTAIEIARAAAAGADHSTLKLFSTDKPRAAYLPKRGQEFDGKRLAEKSRADGSPSFAPEKQFTKFEALRELRAAGVIINSPISPAERAWLDSLFGGADTISETALQSAIRGSQSAIDEAGGADRP